QVLAIGLEGDRAVPFTHPDQHHPNDEVDDGGGRGQNQTDPDLFQGCGASSRCPAVQMISTAARRIMAPATSAEKYSAFPWRKLWLASAGRAATVKAMTAMTAVTRLTTDSRASDKKPTDPVTEAAIIFNPMVTTAAATERYMNRMSSR